MATPNPQVPKDPSKMKEASTVMLSPELLELEKRLNQTMVENIAKGIEAALKPIKDSIDKIMTSSELITRQEGKIKQLTEENSVLKTNLMAMKTEINGIKHKLMESENKSLECNLIF